MKYKILNIKIPSFHTVKGKKAENFKVLKKKYYINILVCARLHKIGTQLFLL